jgi:zinc D-Ala-D-Ala carboxypeptidase
MSNQLTPHFTLSELTASTTGSRLGIDNTPPPEHMAKLVLTAEMLERVRTLLQCPVIVTSGYRCMKLNVAVGGVTSSDHARGQAADIVAPAFGTAYEVAKKLAPFVSMIGVGQLILEGVKGKQWVHVSTRMSDKPSNRVITITDAGAQLGIQVLA